jgi:excisionase family DNA binding protein
MAGDKRGSGAVAEVRQKDWMTSGEVARALNMTDAAIRRWAREGLIQALKTPGGQYRIRRESLTYILQVSGRPDGAPRGKKRSGRRS